MAQTIQVAVASNFMAVLTRIARQFEQETANTVTIVSGSTGKHYAQISHGAPYDIFLAADTWRPQRLEADGRIVAGSRFTYAIGKLVLWSPVKDFVDKQGRVLNKKNFHHLAMASPKLAPYGRAAQQVLQALGSTDSVQTKIVYGQNIGQTFQFVKSGAAELGFVARSQLKQSEQVIQGSYWLVPQTLYQPIKQQAVLLKASTAAEDFMAYLKTDKVLKIILHSGYGTP